VLQQAHEITLLKHKCSNVVVIAEQMVMHVLALIQHYISVCREVLEGRWDIPEIAANTHDLGTRLYTVEEYKRGVTYADRERLQNHLT
jgi:lactate dehydrogenase-like 2-hydroxyacid dehydrogenase